MLLHLPHQQCDLCCLWGLTWTVPTVPRSPPAFLLHQVSVSVAVSPYCGSQSGDPLAEQLANLSVIIPIIFREIFAGKSHQAPLGSSMVGFLELQGKLSKYQTFLVISVLQLMSRNGKEEFLCLAVSVTTARRAWTGRGRLGVWVAAATAVAQGIQVPKVLQALEPPGLPEFAGSLSLWGCLVTSVVQGMQSSTGILSHQSLQLLTIACL